MGQNQPLTAMVWCALGLGPACPTLKMHSYSGLIMMALRRAPQVPLQKKTKCKMGCLSSLSPAPQRCRWGTLSSSFSKRCHKKSGPGPCCVCPQEADALLADGKHAETRLLLLRYLEGNDRDVSLHLALVRACLGLGSCHLTEAVKHARCAQH